MVLSWISPGTEDTGELMARKSDARAAKLAILESISEKQPNVGSYRALDVQPVSSPAV